MKIGIFGGSFNPVHKMHENIAKELIKKGIVDKVIFVPTGSKYKQKNNLLDDKYRYEMLKLIASKYENIEVSDYELKDELVYTYQTLSHFKDEYKECEIYFICGTDNLTYMDVWKNGEYILENYKIIIIKRNTDKIDNILTRLDKYKDNFIITDIEEDDISSSKIREDLKNGLDNDMIDEGVKEYIKENHLYQK